MEQSVSAFHLLPDPPTAPLTVAAHDRSSPVSFADLASGTPATMWLRVTRLGAHDCELAGGADPTFLLAAGGTATAVSTQSPITNGHGAEVAQASLEVVGVDVYRIQIDVLRPGSQWTVQFGNSNTLPCRFIAVVADNDDPDGSGAAQPWINLAREVTLQAGAAATSVITQVVSVPNYGTGPLSIQPGGLSDPFTVIPPATDIAPNACGVLTIQFDPHKQGSHAQTYIVPSNDTAAVASFGHNKVVSVSVNPFDPTPPPTIRPCQVDDGCTDYEAPPGARRARAAEQGAGTRGTTILSSRSDAAIRIIWQTKRLACRKSSTKRWKCTATSRGRRRSTRRFSAPAATFPISRVPSRTRSW